MNSDDIAKESAKQQAEETRRTKEEVLYKNLRSYYEKMSIRMLIISSLAVITILGYMVWNKAQVKSALLPTQYNLLLMALIAFSLATAFHIRYLILRNDPASYLSKEYIIYAPGKIKTLAERILMNRKAVLVNNAFFWMGLVLLLSALVFRLFVTGNNIPAN